MRRAGTAACTSRCSAARCARSAVAAIAARLAERGANIDRIRRLSREPLTTVEVDVSGDDVLLLRRELAAAAAAHGVDVAVSPAGLARRGRRLVVIDVDSTLIQDEVIELLAAHAGRAAEVAAVTERGDARRARLRREPARAGGVPRRAAGVRARRGARRRRLTPGARTLVRTLQAARVHRRPGLRRLHRGRRAARRRLGIQHVRANPLEVADGC